LIKPVGDGFDDVQMTPMNRVKGSTQDSNSLAFSGDGFNLDLSAKLKREVVPMFQRQKDQKIVVGLATCEPHLQRGANK
jgi:hypothetical protein